MIGGNVDAIDIAQQREEENRQEALEAVQRAAYQIPAGEPGVYDLCGFDKPRLIAGICAPCRDEYHLP
jgi:hypothetical protein